MNDSILREQLIQLLDGGNAHIKYEDAIINFPVSSINDKAPNIPYSAWELVEHMRICQKDILDFINYDEYVELQWPEEYWPKKNKIASENEWHSSLKMFLGDIQELKTTVKNPDIDLFQSLPYGDEYTIYREILLVADHNSYHLGQLKSLQRALGLL